MDMQNVSNLVIPEGEVRTIHDKDSRLLWGRVSYSVKYSGDAVQDGAPTPDSPVPVQTVTGEQMVTVSDGIDSEAFSISLGSIELCKIGTYQDYIYKSGNDWYIHKEIGKSVLNGSEAWVQHAYVVNNINGFRLNVGAANSDGGVFANYFRPVTWMSYQATGANGRTYGTITTADPGSSPNVNIYITQPDSSVSTLAQFQTWLSTHNTTAYYAIATPTDTQIADSTLISQLNAIHQFLTRYGYSATVSGNLPLIIDKTNL